ncbi:MAG: DUF4147 domain-containing protein [bacterium]|nr:DUF4147 domain-containing protein [bacterium]
MNPIQDAQFIFAEAVRAVQAPRLMERLAEHPFLRPPGPAGAVRVIGAGKAAMAMGAQAEWQVESALGRPVGEGLVVVPEGYRATYPAGEPIPRRIEVTEGGHPVPNAAGAAAARRTLNLAVRCRAGDLLLVLISGGGSSLWSAFAEGISLEDARATFRLLLRSGAAIAEFNCVRKHLTAIGGGRLGAAAGAARVLTLAISDVVGDDPAVIASGPTVPDPTTFADARAVLERYHLWESLPGPVAAHLSRGLAEPALETPKPGGGAVGGGAHEGAAIGERDLVLLANNRRALEAARAAAVKLGYRAVIAPEPVTGEAREAGRALARAAMMTARQAGVAAGGGPCCLIWGGETTVTVRGDGKGGRNQELALAAALELEAAGDAGRGIALLSGGTDGVDGPTDAAGAWVTAETAAEARRRGFSPEAALENNDAYPLLDRLGTLLKPGPTHTNVMDVQVAVVGQ